VGIGGNPWLLVKRSGILGFCGFFLVRFLFFRKKNGGVPGAPVPGAFGARKPRGGQKVGCWRWVGGGPG